MNDVFHRVSHRSLGDNLLESTPERPVIGDVKVSHQAVTPGRLTTLHGTRQGKRVIPLVFEGHDKLFRAVERADEEAMATLHNEHVIRTWAIRGLGR